MDRRKLAYLCKTAALGAVYVIAAKAAFSIAFVNTSIAPVWLPSGLAVAVALRYGYRAAPGVALGAFVFNALTPVPLWVALLIGAGNSLEAAAAVWLLRRAGFRPAVDRVRDVLALAGLGALAATMVSATIGVTSLLASGVVPPRAAVSSWVLWWSGDAVGVLTVSPLMLWARPRNLRHARVSKARLAEAALLALALVTVVWLGVTVRAARPIMAFPIVVWAAVRYRQAGAILASLFCSIALVYATAHGFGPYVQLDRMASLLTTQVFVGAVIATSLLLAAATVERETALRALTAEREQTQAILDSASDPFISFDRAGVLAAWNSSAEALFGWRADEVIGQRLADTIIPHHWREACREGRRRTAAGGAARVAGNRTEVAGLHRDGHLIPLELTVWQVQSDTRQFHAFLRDLSEPRRLAQALESARDEALEASRLKSQFLATMSHEIRTPMNAVIGLSASLRADAGALDDRQRRSLDGIHSAGQVLQAIIDDILDFSKLEADRLILDSVDFDLDAVIGEATGMLAAAAEAKRLTVTASRQPELPAALRGDPVRLRQILLNLLSNAVKFTERGDVTVRAALAGAVAEGGTLRVRIEVADTGIGIPADKQARVFDAFVQADATTTRDHGGTGLGLAIARRLAEAMGGQLEMRSAPGQGSTFACTVPLEVAARVVTLAQPAMGPPDPGAPAEGPQLLLAEDNALNRLVAVEVLAILGYRVDIATNGQQAVEMVASGHYEAILMDCQMPVMDGYTAAAAIRRMEGAGPRTPIIATTASVLAEDRARCLAAGMDDFIAKPIDMDTLAATLARWTSPRDREPAIATGSQAS